MMMKQFFISPHTNNLYPKMIPTIYKAITIRTPTVVSIQTPATELRSLLLLTDHTKLRRRVFENIIFLFLIIILQNNSQNTSSNHPSSILLFVTSFPLFVSPSNFGEATSFARRRRSFDKQQFKQSTSRINDNFASTPSPASNTWVRQRTTSWLSSSSSSTTPQSTTTATSSSSSSGTTTGSSDFNDNPSVAKENTELLAKTDVRNSELDTEEKTLLIAQEWVNSFSKSLNAFLSSKGTDPKTIEQYSSNVLDHFYQGDDDETGSNHSCYWRDMVYYTWNIITMHGITGIQSFLTTSSSNDDLYSTQIDTEWEIDTKLIQIQQPTPTSIEFWCTIQNNVGIGRAHVRLKKTKKKVDLDDAESKNNGDNASSSEWKAYTLLTVLSELKERPFAIGPNRRSGLPMPIQPIQDRIYFHDERKKKKNNNNDDEEYYIVIIGGGQGGLSLGARLELLGIPYIILESSYTVGSSWMKRYPNLYLHDPCYYNHMPYLPFPETWPIFCPRNKVAQWLQFYATALDLHIQTNTRVVSARPLESENDNNNLNEFTWILTVQELSNNNNNDNDSNQQLVTRTIKARNIVFATGNSSHPRLPKFRGLFRGIQTHSSQYQGGKDLMQQLLKSEHYITKKKKKDEGESSKDTVHIVVVGCNNSAFDICQDVWEQLSSQYNIHVTMIQRSPSMVVSTDSVLRIGLGPLYRQDAPYYHEDADYIATTVPYDIAITKNWKLINAKMKENDAVMHKALRAAGYELDTDGPNGTGIFAKSATEGGGFYINMGCVELIIDGHVTVKYATVEELEDDSVLIRNKRTQQLESIRADAIIYATGYGTLDQYVQQICGSEIASTVGKTWGLGYGYNPRKDPGPWEGELRNMWKPTTVSGLWFQGGNLAQNRHYSRFLALQLAARYMNIIPSSTQETVYGIPKPTPLLPME